MAPIETMPEHEILVVDDNAAIRESLGELLTGEGYRVRLAGNGEEALRLLRQHSPSLIILDLMMPVMNGWEFRQQQLGDPAIAEIPVVVVTGTLRSCERPAALRPAAFFEKPLDVSTLLEVVASLC